MSKFMIYRFLMAFSMVMTSFQQSSFASERFADVDLWLPKTYQDHYLRLLDAAEKVEKDPYCHRLISGGMIEGRSTQEHMYFHFRCRAEDRKTFSIEVDGKSLEVTNVYKKQKEAEKKAEEERQRLAEEAAKAEADRIEAERLAKLRSEQSRYWKICRKAMRKRLKLFNNIKVLTKGIPDPIIEGEKFTYIVLFDAENPKKESLHYKVSCDISSLTEHKVAVVARKDK